MHVFLPVEILSRELDSRLLLATHLANRGVTTLVGASSLCTRLAIRLGGGVYLHNRMSDGDTSLFEELRKSGVNCVAIDEEALNLPELPAEVARTNPEGINVELLDWAFCSTKHEYQALLEMFPQHGHKIRLVGSPRVQMQSSAFSTYWKSHPPRNMPSARFFLVTTNFSHGNLAKSYGMTPQSHLTRILTASDYSIAVKEKSLRRVDDLVSYERNLFSEYVNGIRNLAHRFPSLNFVVRPHPSEEVSEWRRGLKDLKNVLVSRSGSLGSWMSSARGVIHAGSTTSMEAKTRGIPTIYFLPTEGNAAALRGVSGYPEYYGRLCRNAEEVGVELRRITSAGTQESHHEAKEILSSNDDSARQISDLILNALASSKTRPTDLRFVALALAHGALAEFASLMRVLLSHLASLIGREADLGSSYEKFGFHSPYFFTKRLTRLHRLEYPLQQSSPRFFPLGPRLFLIRPEPD